MEDESSSSPSSLIVSSGGIIPVASITKKFRQALTQLNELVVSKIYLDETKKKGLDLALLQLRECNRTMALLLRNRKKRVQGGKNALDRTELSKQNLLYERRHLEATLEETKRHESLYLTIPLKEQEEDEMIRMRMEFPNEHDLMLHRLQGELESRKRLADQLKSGHDSLELARSRLVLKRKELEKLRDQLECIVKAADPFLNSHSRFFIELEKTQQALHVEEVVIERERLLEQLQHHFVTFSETNSNVRVNLFEELEAGEEEVDESDDNNNDDDNGGGGGGASSAFMSTDDDFASMANSSKSSHARFMTHSQNSNRRFPFSHLCVEIDQGQMSGGHSARLYFYPIEMVKAPLVVMVVRIELANQELTPEEAENFLLSLPVEEPALLLTTPHESIVPGESGHVPFRWIQSLAGRVSDASFDDFQATIRKFITSIQRKLTSLMMVEEKDLGLPQTDTPPVPPTK